jgi:gamma-glutamyltranspeptidase / glutathione hydrolase
VRTPLFLVTLLLTPSCALWGTSLEDGPEAGAVVAEHPLAVQAGLDVLARGGNAADAAVATALVLAVVLPQAGNLGGGGFAVWAPVDGAALAIDFREVAPESTDPLAYFNEAKAVVAGRSLRGPLAVGVPGSPAGIWDLYERCGSGRFNFRTLADEAIRLAEDGWPIDPWLARSLRSKSLKGRMNPAASAVFYPDGQALTEGDLLVQPALAETLRRYARRGPKAIYEGEVAQQIVSELRRSPVPEEAMGTPAEGFFQVEISDLSSYRTELREPTQTWFRGWEILGMPPPSSGGLVMAEVLAILEGFPLETERVAAAESGYEPTSRLLHLWIEAMRHAFADRARHMGDPAFYEVPSSELLSDERILKARVSIGERADLSVGPWEVASFVESDETTHLSVLDREGNAVSLTTTLNTSFGSCIMVEGAGFLLNNEMDDFAVTAGVANTYGLVGGEANVPVRGKRPLSSMSPTIIRDDEGRVRIVIGAPGGPRIITAVTQVVLRLLVLGQDLVSAVAAPRLHQQWRPEQTRFEGGWAPEHIVDLEARGHPVSVEPTASFASVQAIRVDYVNDSGDEEAAAVGRVEVASDPRRGGVGGVTGRGLTVPSRPKK